MEITSSSFTKIIDLHWLLLGYNLCWFIIVLIPTKDELYENSILAKLRFWIFAILIVNIIGTIFQLVLKCS